MATNQQTTQPSMVVEKKNKKLFSFQLDSVQNKSIEKFFRKYSELFGESETKRHFGLGNMQDIEFAWMHATRQFANNSNAIRNHTITTLEMMEDGNAAGEVMGVMKLLQKQHDVMVECFNDPSWVEEERARVKAMIAASEQH